MASPDPTPPYWLLIAVLSSNFPLRPEVSLRLYQAAYRLYHTRDNIERIQGDLISGKVVRLHKDLAIGSVTGPAFEAELSTELGEGRVSFLLTRQGLEEGDQAARSALGAPEATAGSAKYLN